MAVPHELTDRAAWAVVDVPHEVTTGRVLVPLSSTQNMTFQNNTHLRKYLSEAGMLPLLVYESFELEAIRFELALAQVCAQHPYLEEAEAAARAAFLVIARAAEKGQPKPRTRKRLGIRFGV